MAKITYGKLLFCTLLWWLVGPWKYAQAQAGCTDPQASNYDPAAATNDGSCLYPITYAPLMAVSTLPDTLLECSGLEYAGNRWWAHNDSGNDNVFFGIDPLAGTVLQTVKLKQANDEDWEDIASDPTHLYIGDFGNNASGNRTDLGIYRFPIASIGFDPDEKLEPGEYEFIPFAYADQTDFSDAGNNNTSFDCESMLIRDGKIHLFTKDWVGLQTAHYIVDPVTHVATKVETFNPGCLITAADISPDGKTIVMLGYNISGNFGCFLWVLWDFQGDQFFSGNKRRIDIGYPLQLGKPEGIGFFDNHSGYIGSEELNYGPLYLPPSLWAFDIGQWTSDTKTAVQPSISLFPNPFSDYLKWEGFEPGQPVNLRLVNMLGNTVLQAHALEGLAVPAALPAGIYQVIAEQNGTQVIRSMAKQ